MTRRLTADQVRVYREWIANDRRLRAIIAEMRATTIQTADTPTKPHQGSNPNLGSCHQPGSRAPDALDNAERRKLAPGCSIT
jgi:hypothetical protein